MPPRPGTRLNAIYATFKANPGKPIESPFVYKDRGMKDVLLDRYGLDIRCDHATLAPKGFAKGRSKGLWVLVGEYLDNGKYVKYVED